MTLELLATVLCSWRLSCLHHRIKSMNTIVTRLGATQIYLDDWRTNVPLGRLHHSLRDSTVSLQSRPLTNPTSSRRPAAPTQARDALATAGNPPLRPHYQADSVSEAPCSTHSEGAPPLSDSGPAAAALLPLLRGLCRDWQRRLLRAPSRRSTGPAWETQLPQPTCAACKGLRSHPGHRCLASHATRPNTPTRGAGM